MPPALWQPVAVTPQDDVDRVAAAGRQTNRVDAWSKRNRDGRVTDREDIFDRARTDGVRRLSAPPLVQLVSSMVAGLVLASGILVEAVVATAVSDAAARGVGSLAGAMSFAVAVVVIVAGRFELFAENVYGPATAAAEGTSAASAQVLRLLLAALVMNVLGAAALTAALAVDGALPTAVSVTLTQSGLAVAQTPWAAVLVRGLLAGILLALLSYLAAAVDVARARLLIAYMIGFLLAIGPFDYVVVSAARLLFTYWVEGDVQYGALSGHLVLSFIGNTAGAVLFFTMTRQRPLHRDGP